MALIAAVLRTCLIVALAAGLALPKLTAVLAEISPNVWVVVLCTGSSVETITIGPDNTPIPKPDPLVEHCVASQSPTNALRGGDQALRLLRDHAHAFSIRERLHRHDLIHTPFVPRGPPVSV